VPFFLSEGQILATGRGEVLQPIELPLNYSILVVIPAISISTAEIYGTLKINLTEKHQNSLLEKRIDLSKLAFLAKRFGNDLEGPALSKFPELGEIKRSLLGSGAFYSSMSGSGSAFYGLFSEDEGHQVGFEKSKKLGCRIVECKPILMPPIKN
jgi:4-diphosphocytidyl-2-C-methyl-D-erythritol kinase